MMIYRIRHSGLFGGVMLRRLLNLFVVLVVFVGGQAAALAAESNKYWLDLGVGSNMGSATLNWGRTNHIFSLSMSNFDSDEALDIFSREGNSRTELQTIDALISFHQSSKNFNLLMGAGLSYVSGEIHYEEATRDSVLMPERHYIRTEELSGVGVPLSLRVIWCPANGIGVGAHFGFNLNGAQTFLNTGIQVSVGQLK